MKTLFLCFLYQKEAPEPSFHIHTHFSHSSLQMSQEERFKRLFTTERCKEPKPKYIQFCCFYAGLCWFDWPFCALHGTFWGGSRWESQMETCWNRPSIYHFEIARSLWYPRNQVRYLVKGRRRRCQPSSGEGKLFLKSTQHQAAETIDFRRWMIVYASTCPAGIHCVTRTSRHILNWMEAARFWLNL